MKSQNTQKLVLCALFAALSCVLGPLSIPLPGLVPLSLATLAAMLAGGVLGAKWGVLSQLVYMLLGLAGLPVFSGFGAGPAKLFGPTGGYLFGYLAIALFAGLFMRRFEALSAGKRICGMMLSMLMGTAVCYALGTAWFMAVTNTPLLGALTMCVLPFLFGDAVKIVAAAFLIERLRVFVSGRRKAA